MTGRPRNSWSATFWSGVLCRLNSGARVPAGRIPDFGAGGGFTDAMGGLLSPGLFARGDPLLSCDEEPIRGTGGKKFSLPKKPRRTTTGEPEGLGLLCKKRRAKFSPRPDAGAPIRLPKGGI